MGHHQLVRVQFNLVYGVFVAILGLKESISLQLIIQDIEYHGRLADLRLKNLLERSL